MKKLSKLSINPKILIKNDELIKLRGGYGGPCVCIIRDNQGCYVEEKLCDPILGDCCEQCDFYVNYYWPGEGYFCDCNC